MECDLSSLLLAMIVVSLGCHGMDKIEKKSIDSLYAEAVNDAERRTATQYAPSYYQNEIIHAEPYTEMYEESAAANDLSSDDLIELTAGEDDSASDNGPKKISEVFEQTDIREAILILASLAETTVIIDDSVGGLTSANITDETFDQALDKILLPIGLVYVYRDGKYIIAPPDPDSPLFSLIAQRTQYVPVNHQASALTLLLPSRFKSYIQSLPERNLVIVDAPAAIGNEILERLRELDQPVAQVELEAIVCVVSPDSGFRFGLDWGHVVGVEGVDTLKAGLSGLTFSGSASPQGVRDSFSDFAVTSAFVRLLAQEGYISIRAAPRVTAKDGEKAQISINRETFFSLQASNSNVLFQQNVQTVQAGISLEITPHVHGDMVAVDIDKAEVSEDIRTSDGRAELTSNPYPIINRRVVSTKVNVRDGQTIVIGGLVQRQTVDRINRIPGLSAIPGVGKLFQTIEKQEQDAEVAIFISPRIVPCDPALLP